MQGKQQFERPANDSYFTLAIFHIIKKKISDACICGKTMLHTERESARFDDRSSVQSRVLSSELQYSPGMNIETRFVKNKLLLSNHGLSIVGCLVLSILGCTPVLLQLLLFIIIFFYVRLQILIFLRCFFS